MSRRVMMGKTRKRGTNVPMGRVSLYNKAITVEVTERIHKLLKERAALRNIPMSQWITRVIIRSLNKEIELE